MSKQKPVSDKAQELSMEELDKVVGGLFIGKSLTGRDDDYQGTAGNNTVDGRGGNDTMDGLGGNDFLWGGDGNDSLVGGQGDDSLYGEEGNDTLAGGAGNDRLHGGEGGDTFCFTTGGGSDVISDFRAAEGDRISLENLSQADWQTLNVSQVYNTQGYFRTTDTVITFGSGNNVTTITIQNARLTLDDILNMNPDRPR